MKIPERIKEFCEFYDTLMSNAPEDYVPWFFPCEKNGKDPCAVAILKIDSNSKGSWHHISARLTKQQCIEHLKEGYNIGISARKGDPLVIGDIDSEKYLDQIPENTLAVTSRKRAGAHFFGWDKDGTAKINLPVTNKGEVRSENQYVLACGSYVPFNLENEKELKAYNNLPEWARNEPWIGYYTIRNKVSPRDLSFSDFPKFFQDENLADTMKDSEVKQREEFKGYPKDGKYSGLFKLKVSDIVGSISEGKRMGHPLHDSTTDANFSLSEDGNLAHCWRDMVSLNAVQYLCVKAGYSSCKDAGTPHKGRGFSKIKGDKRALESAYNEAVKMGLIEKLKESGKAEVGKEIITDEHFKFESFSDRTNFLSIVREFLKIQPVFYDKSRIWWFWDSGEFCWKQKDEVDLMNAIDKYTRFPDVDFSVKQGLLEAFKRLGRNNSPKKSKREWIQFKNKIFDIRTGKSFDASPEYFVTNPIPYDVGDSEDTPEMDNLFAEWVCSPNQDKSYIKTLYEIIGYCTISDKFLQTLIALTGSGSNGKGSFLKLLNKFIGDENCCSSDLKRLSGGNFETSALYKKLLCTIGEVSYNDLKNTNLLKRLSGEDPIRYEFKGKTPFTETSPTTIIMATNSLPATPDKTIGFYRRWLIVDFPNQFSIRQNILERIPEQEYPNLARKVLNILKGLYESGCFTNSGSYEEREKRYEERSNPIEKYLELYCEDEVGEKIKMKELAKQINLYLKQNHLRPITIRLIGSYMRENGYSIGTRDFPDGDKAQAIINLGFKTDKKLTKLTKLMNPQVDSLHGKTTESPVSSVSFVSFSELDGVLK